MENWRKAVIILQIVAYIVAIIGIYYLYQYMQSPCNCKDICTEMFYGPKIPVNFSVT